MSRNSLAVQIEDILTRHPAGRQGLIAILQDVQELLGYLSEEAVRELSDRTGISANEIYGVATFYRQFRFAPPGEHRIVVCQGTACHVRGGRQVLAEFERLLGIRAGQTTADGRFELERVACIGCCALAPTATVDGEVHARMTPQKARAIVARHSDREAAAE